MKTTVWRFFSVAFLAWIMAMGLPACSDDQSQQQEDQVIQQGEEGEEGEEGEDGNYDEDGQDGQNAQNGQDQQQYAENGQQDGGMEGDNGYGDEGGQNQAAAQQDELQDIIDGMNTQNGGEGEGEAATEGQAYQEGEQQPPVQEGESLNASQDPAMMAQAQAGTPVEQQMAAAGMAAAPGLPELGSKMSYIVQSGDTLANIAEKIYGDREKWREIAEFTGMANPNRIYPGDVIYYQLTDQTMAFSSAYEAVNLAEVTVQPGDTLSTIASRVLGSSQDWKLVWRQNDNIDNPDVLTVGQTIYYIDPGMLTAAVDQMKTHFANLAKEKVESVNQVVETIKDSSSNLVTSIEKELGYDLASIEAKNFARAI